MDPRIAKQAAQALKEVAQENDELTAKLAASSEKLAQYERKEECLKLAIQIADRDGVKDYRTVLAKAKDLEESGEDLRVVAAGLKYASAKDFGIGIVADRPGLENPDEDFVSYLMNSD